MFAPLRDFFSRNNAWLILLLIVLYKLGDAFAMSLSTLFLIRGVGFNAGDVGLVNKTLGLLATIIGASYGGLLMQRMTLFRALLLFGILQAVSNAGYWLLAITTKHLVSMAGLIFLENLCGGMGTAAFVALLMTLCNTSFSATQFALLSALSAVGRVYVGPIAGWFVETHGWAWFYLFTIAISVPGLVLLLVCKQTLEYTQRTGTFMVRMTYPLYYRFALRLLAAGCALLFIWLTLTIAHALGANAVETINDNLMMLEGIFVISGELFGSVLDYLSLRNPPSSEA